MDMDSNIDKIGLERANKRLNKIKEGQQVFNPLRPIRKFIQLVQQSNDHFLFPKQTIHDKVIGSFSLAEYSNNPIKTIFIKDDGNIISFLGKSCIGQPRKLAFRSIQKINHSFINPEGFSHDWYYIFENLFLYFINLESKQELASFIIRTGFSVFPNSLEFAQLLLEYERAGIEGVASFRVVNDGTLPVIWHEEKNDIRKKIEAINLDFLWGKKEKLLNYTQKYQSSELVVNDLLYINEQMENISDALMDAETFHKTDLNNRSVEKIIKDTRNLEEIINQKKIKDTNLLEHYRIYGHYALCCFELFLDIMQKNKIAVCENERCKRYFKPKRKGQVYCEDKRCQKSRDAIRTKKSLNKRKK